MVDSQRIPGDIEAEMWSLATEICQEAKPDSDERRELFSRFYGLLIQRWQNECQNLIALDEQEWKDCLRREYLSLARGSREKDWQRVLSYKRCRYLRYIIILATGTMVAYLCSQETIFILFSRSLRSWNIWYYPSAFVALVGVPMALAVIVGGGKWSSQRIVQQLVAATVVLGYTTPIALFFITLLWQWRVGTFDLLDWVAGFLALAFFFGGLVTGYVEVFPTGKQHRVHPLQDILFDRAKLGKTGSVREQVDRKLIQFAFDVCNAAHMDDDAFRDKSAENLYNSVFARWSEYSQKNDDPWDALNMLLRKFGSVANAGDRDPRWMRILFYKRHETTRYLTIIGISLIVLYLRLLAIDFPTGDGHGRWGLWGLNILNGSMIASCIAVARQSWFAKIRLVRVLFGFGVLWGISRVGGDAFMAVATVHDFWPDGWAFWGLLSIMPTLSVMIAVLLCFAASEYFFPLPAWIVVPIRRWVYQFRGHFARR